MIRKTKRLIIITLIFITMSISITFARSYKISNQEVVDGNKKVPCWVGWKEYHFGTTTPLSKKGYTIKYVTPMIIGGVTSYYETECVTNGYGHYGLNFSKHVLGLLNYMKNRVSDYDTTYVPIHEWPKLDENGNVIEPAPVKMREAIKIIIKSDIIYLI